MIDDRDLKSLRAVNLGLGVNVLLAIVKTFFGVLVDWLFDCRNGSSSVLGRSG